MPEPSPQGGQEADDLDVLSFGEALVDFFPTETGIPLAEVELFQRQLGGAPANVAVGLARLGLRTGLMTLVGPDEFGRFVRTRLAQEGIDVAAVGTHAKAKTGVTFVSVARDGQRSFLFFRHPSADQMIATSDVSTSQVRRARLFHFGSSTLSREPARAATLRALDLAREHGAIVSCDPNLRPHLWEDPREAPPLLASLFSRIDILKVSDDELAPLAGSANPEAGARALIEQGARLVIVTLGARGCYFHSPAGSGFVDGEKVAVVDTTGAGDGFVAGFIASLMPRFRDGTAIADLDPAALRAACALGNTVGARAATALGATTGLPRREDPSIRAAVLVLVAVAGIARADSTPPASEPTLTALVSIHTSAHEAARFVASAFRVNLYMVGEDREVELLYKAPTADRALEAIATAAGLSLRRWGNSFLIGPEAVVAAATPTQAKWIDQPPVTLDFYRMTAPKLQEFLSDVLHRKVTDGTTGEISILVHHRPAGEVLDFLRALAGEAKALPPVRGVMRGSPCTQPAIARPLFVVELPCAKPSEIELVGLLALGAYRYALVRKAGRQSQDFNVPPSRAIVVRVGTSLGDPPARLDTIGVDAIDLAGNIHVPMIGSRR